MNVILCHLSGPCALVSCKYLTALSVYFEYDNLHNIICLLWQYCIKATKPQIKSLSVYFCSIHSRITDRARDSGRPPILSRLRAKCHILFIFFIYKKYYKYSKIGHFSDIYIFISGGKVDIKSAQSRHKVENAKVESS